MDATTAALLGAAIGVTGTLGASFVTPYFTARHARSTRLTELRSETYVSAIRLAHSVLSEISKSMGAAPPDHAIDDEADAELANWLRRRLVEIAGEMAAATAELALLGSPQLAEEYADITDQVMAFAEAITTDDDLMPLAAEMGRMLRAFVEKARKHIRVR